MSVLRAFLEPRSIALLGAAREGLAGAVTTNLLVSQPSGQLFLLDSYGKPVDASYAPLDEVPLAPDLAVVCGPASEVAGAFERVVQKGIRAAVIITEDPDGSGPATPLKKSLRDLSREFGCRFLGPGCVGLNMPAIAFNASWIGAGLGTGDLALLSQSASIAASVTEWAASRGIGFSRVISTGDETDVGISEMLGLLAADTRTKGILLYLRSLVDGRAFMSSARAAARIKPVLVLKPRGGPSGSPDDISIDDDAVYDAAFARAGLLRIDDTEEWFDAAESLGRTRARRPGRLAIIANGDGPAQLAAAPIAQDGLLATLTDNTMTRLQGLLSGGRAATNPVIFQHDASPEHYARALATLQDDIGVGAVLVMHSPLLGNASTAVAQVVVDATKLTNLQISTCCFGARLDDSAHSSLARSNVSTYDLPEKAARAFIHVERYRRNQSALRQLPDSRRQQLANASFRSDQTPAAQTLLTTDETESITFLDACGRIWRAIKANRAMLGYADCAAVLGAFGFQVSSSEPKLPSVSLTFAIADNPSFGRVIVITAAGKRHAALPPLNPELVKELATDAQVTLQTAAGIVVSADAIGDVAIRLANLAVELPEVVALEISIGDIEKGRLSFVAPRIRVAASHRASNHLSIRPYPRELEERIALKGGRQVLLRPIRLEDIKLYHEMLNATPKEQLFLRFCGQFGDITQAIPTELLANLLHFDYSRDISFIAVAAGSDGKPEALGLVDAFLSPDRDEAEYSILVRSELAGTGLGKTLMMKIITYCRAHGVGSLFGLVLRENSRMLGLCVRLGFAKVPDQDDDMIKVVLPL
jgi:acetyltransferase